MSKEIILLIDALAKKKNITKEFIFSALEQALSSAIKRILKKDFDIIVLIDRVTGKYKSFRRWQLVSNKNKIKNAYRQKTKSEVLDFDNYSSKKDYFDEKIDSIKFGRISAQIAKQVILKNIRNLEQEKLLNDFLKTGEKIISGIVKRIDRNDAVIESKMISAILPKKEMIPKENLYLGDRIKAVIVKIDNKYNVQKLILSRISINFLCQLFNNEIPEIEQGLLKIKAIVRDAGIRAKIAVITYDKRIDPIGTCVGIRGSRINAIRNELCGEQIDIILWSKDPAQFVIGAISPAKVNSIIVDKEKNVMDVIVDEINLSKAIGSKGQNVRLASNLTGWQINILTSKENSKREFIQMINLKNIFIKKLNLSEEISNILIYEGFKSLEEIAYVTIKDLLKIKYFDENIAEEIKNRAKNELLKKDFFKKELYKSYKELLNIGGINYEIAKKLISIGIENKKSLSILSREELMEINNINKKQAIEIILFSRIHYFNN